MRKIVLLMHASLDGFVARPDGGMDWIRLSDDMWDYVDGITAVSDTAVFGEVTYRMMEGYWPTAADKDNASKHDINHAKWVNAANKIVFSNTMTSSDWDNTQIVAGDIAEKVRGWKQQPGKNIVIFGSPTLAHSFMQSNLIDEYRLNINPIVLGEGKPLFKDIEKEIRLRLVNTVTFASGVVGLTYEKE